MTPRDLQVTSPHAAADALATPPTETHELPTETHELPTEAHQLGSAQAPPRLADGIELIGEFEDSGFKKAPFIARRSDGQVVQMHQMLFRLAEQIDGNANLEQTAASFGDAIQRKVEVADVEMLIDQQLRPLGIVAPPEGAEPIELGKVDPLLALKFRASVVPDGAVRRLTTLFRPLFLPPVVVLVVLGLVGLDGWLFFAHGVSQSVRHTLYQPALMLMLIGGMILATAFHEVGHATACRYGGAKPGVMGVGIYIVWPAFYTDITDAYRLGKWGRLRTDMGGMYFNAIFALLIAGLYAVTSFEPLLLLVLLQNFAILQQSLPLLRLDGYYILSDLTGVPDIFQRIRAVLSSLIPGRPANERVKELKTWVRAVVTVYVLFIVLFLGATVLAMVINLPRIVSTGYDSAALRFQAIGPDFGHGQAVRGVLDLIQMLFLVLPGAGLVYTAGRVGRRVGSGALSWTSGHPGRRAILGATAAAAVAIAAFSWWPNGQYRPVQPGERGTVTGLFHEVAALPTGRPSLTVQRQRQLGGAPTEVQLKARQEAGRVGEPGRSRHRSGTPAKTSTGASATGTPAHAATTPASTTPGSTTPGTTTTSANPTATPTVTTPASSPAGAGTASGAGAGAGAGATTPAATATGTSTTHAPAAGTSTTP